MFKFSKFLFLFLSSRRSLSSQFSHLVVKDSVFVKSLCFDFRHNLLLGGSKNDFRHHGYEDTETTDGKVNEDKKTFHDYDYTPSL